MPESRKIKTACINLPQGKLCARARKPRKVFNSHGIKTAQILLGKLENQSVYEMFVTSEQGEKLRRLIGAGGAIVFKGTGFYKTDYRSDSYKKGAEADKGSSGGGDGGKKADSAPKKSGSGEG